MTSEPEPFSLSVDMRFDNTVIATAQRREALIYNQRSVGRPGARPGVIATYEAALWEIYKLSGADTDGDEGPGALIAGMGYEGYARVVREAVARLREDYDECLGGGLMARLRNAGSRWRILVHDRTPGERMSGVSHSITSDAKMAGPPGEWHDVNEMPGTEFDELVIGRWIHLEQMNTGQWWMNIGGVTVHVHADRDGRPKSVTVAGPGDYAEAVPGCRYECDWSRENDG